MPPVFPPYSLRTVEAAATMHHGGCLTKDEVGCKSKQEVSAA